MGKTVKSHQLIRKKYAKVLVLFLVFATALSLGGLSFPAYATDCPSGVPNCCPNSSDTYVSIKVNINGTYTNCVPAGTNGDVQTNPIFVWAIGLLKFLAGGVGIGVTAGIVWGGILYATSQGNAGQVKKAISVIINSVVALFLFIFMAAFVNFVIPGGIFK